MCGSRANWTFSFHHITDPLPCALALQLVVADRHEQYSSVYEDVLCFNPSSFHSSDFSFMAYWPAKRDVEMRCVCVSGLPHSQHILRNRLLCGSVWCCVQGCVGSCADACRGVCWTVSLANTGIA